MSFWKAAYLSSMEWFFWSFCKLSWAASPWCWDCSSALLWRLWTFWIRLTNLHKPSDKYSQNRLVSSWVHGLSNWGEIPQQLHILSWRAWSSNWNRREYLYPKSTKNCYRSCALLDYAWGKVWVQESPWVCIITLRNKISIFAKTPFT